MVRSRSVWALRSHLSIMVGRTLFAPLNTVRTMFPNSFENIKICPIKNLPPVHSILLKKLCPQAFLKSQGGWLHFFCCIFPYKVVDWPSGIWLPTMRMRCPVCIVFCANRSIITARPRSEATNSHAATDVSTIKRVDFTSCSKPNPAMYLDQ